MCLYKGYIKGFALISDKSGDFLFISTSKTTATCEEKRKVFHDKLIKEKARSMGLYLTVPYLGHLSSDGSRRNSRRYDDEEVNDPPLGRRSCQAEREHLQETEKRRASSHQTVVHGQFVQHRSCDETHDLFYHLVNGRVQTVLVLVPEVHSTGPEVEVMGVHANLTQHYEHEENQVRPPSSRPAPQAHPKQIHDIPRIPGAP